MSYTVFTDGGARGNPGPAAIGIHITNQEFEIQHGEQIGETTNNVAEYTALKRAFELLISREELPEPVREVVCNLDSELVVKQLNGVYKIKDQKMQSLAKAIKDLLAEHSIRATFQHVRREQNKIADSLVNKALDNQL